MAREEEKQAKAEAAERRKAERAAEREAREAEPKPAVSAYLHFCKAMREELKAGEAVGPNEMMKAMGERWKALSAEEKVRALGSGSGLGLGLGLGLGPSVPRRRLTPDPQP